MCVVPPALGASSAKVTLSRSGESPQNIGTFRYAAPMITGITPAKGTVWWQCCGHQWGELGHWEQGGNNSLYCIKFLQPE